MTFSLDDIDDIAAIHDPSLRWFDEKCEPAVSANDVLLDIAAAVYMAFDYPWKRSHPVVYRDEAILLEMTPKASVALLFWNQWGMTVGTMLATSFPNLVIKTGTNIPLRASRINP